MNYNIPVKARGTHIHGELKSFSDI